MPDTPVPPAGRGGLRDELKVSFLVDGERLDMDDKSAGSRSGEISSISKNSTVTSINGSGDEAETGKVLIRPLWRSLQDSMPFGTWGNVKRFGVPLLILINAGLLIWTQVGTIGHTILELGSNHETLADSTVKSYTTVENIRMTFKAGATLLGLLIGWSSLIFPHVIQATLFIVWTLPMSTRTRGNTLWMVSQSSKLVFAGTVNAGISGIAFLINVELESTLLHSSVGLKLAQTATDATNIQAAVYFFSIMLAQFMLYQHRYAPMARKLRQESWDYFAVRAATVQPQYDDASRTAVGSVRTSSRVFWGIAVLLASVTGVVCASLNERFAKIELNGLVRTLGSSPPKYLVPINFPKDASQTLGNAATDNFNEALYATLFIAVPLAAIAVAMVLWVTPLSKRAQESTYVLLEVLSGFSCLELWFITGCISLSSLKIVCDALLAGISVCEVLSVSTGLVCFSVVSEFSENAWWMLLAALAHRFCLMGVMYQVRRANGTLIDS